MTTTSPAPSSGLAGFWDFLGSLAWIVFLGIVGLIGLGVWVKHRKAKQNKTTPKPPMQVATQEIPPPLNSPVRLFLDIQTAFARNDAATLAKLLGPDMQGFADEARAGRFDATAKHTMTSVQYEIRKEKVDRLSVLYEATDTDPASAGRFRQLWHFTVKNGLWALNGIDNIGD